MRSILEEPVVIWLRKAYRDELPSNYDHVFETPYIANRSGDNTHGAWADRLYGDKFVLWLKFGQEWVPEEWLLQAHEAVKRTRNGGSRTRELDYAWLRYVLLWAPPGCVCGHGGPVEHLSAIFGCHGGYVRHRTLAAARKAAALVGVRRDPSSPISGVALPPPTPHNVARIPLGRARQASGGGRTPKAQPTNVVKSTTDVGDLTTGVGPSARKESFRG